MGARALRVGPGTHDDSSCGPGTLGDASCPGTLGDSSCPGQLMTRAAHCVTQLGTC